MPPILIDTHAHLDDDRFRQDLPQVLERASRAGVQTVVTVATTAEDSLACVDLARRFACIFATVGLQPNNLAQAGASDWDAITHLVTQPKVIAVGETGLDRYWKDTPFPQQEDFFVRHLQLARKHELPVVIHCRQAESDMVRVLREEFERSGPIRGVMHSFTGDEVTAQACLSMGLYISFAGMLTYKKSQPLRDVAQKIPLDRLVVETDSPYLSPQPVRGKRNEPANVVHTAECLAQLHNLQLDQAAELTTRNAHTLFKL